MTWLKGQARLLRADDTESINVQRQLVQKRRGRSRRRRNRAFLSKAAAIPREGVDGFGFQQDETAPGPLGPAAAAPERRQIKPWRAMQRPAIPPFFEQANLHDAIRTKKRSR